MTLRTANLPDPVGLLRRIYWPHGYSDGVWLPFLNTYRTMCRAPEPNFRQILEDVRGLRFGA